MTEYRAIDPKDIIPAQQSQPGPKYTPFTGEVMSAPGDNPVAKAMASQNAPISPIDEPSMLPKIGTTAVASLPKDPMLKARYLATKIFPDRPVNEALSRMGYDGSRFYYIANDGKPYFAEPMFDPVNALGKTAAELPDTIASKFGPALPATGGIVGGILGGPEPASVGTAAAGGMLGESVRQAMAKWLADEERSTLDRYMGLGGAAVEQGAGQLIGLGVAKGGSALLERNPLKVSGYDASKMTPAKVNEMQQNADLARSHGIDVTPGEAGKVTSLLQNQRQLLRQPESADIIGDFYEKRNLDQIPAAWSRYLTTVSPQASSAVANRETGAAAKAVIQTGRDARSAAADPLYTEAKAANQSMASPELDRILRTPAGQSALKAAATTMQNKMSLMGVSDPALTALKDELVSIGKMTDPDTGAGVAAGLKLETYDLIKRKLFELEQGAKDARTGAATTDSAAISDLRRGLTAQLDKLDVTTPPPALTEADLLKRYPGVINAGKRAKLLAEQPTETQGAYARARKVFETESPPVTDLEKGIVGIVAKDKPNALQNLPKVLLSASSSDPYSIAQAKSAFQKAGKMGEWDAMTRSFLQNTFDDAVKNGGNAGPANSLWKNIAGDRRQMANLKAALGSTQFSALEDLMKVAQMVKRAPAEGSPTATDLTSRSGFAGGMAKGIASTVRGVNPLNIPDAIASKITDISAGKNAAALADAITNPKAIQSLKKLRVLRPGTKQFVAEATYLGSLLGWNAAASAINPGAPMEPGAIPEGVQ